MVEMKKPPAKSMIAMSENEIEMQLKKVQEDDELFKNFRAAPDSKQRKLKSPPKERVS